MWSRKHEQCRECGTTERKHYGKGLCWRCYNRAKYQTDPEPQKARSARHYRSHAEEKCDYQRDYYNRTRDVRLAHMKARREEQHFSGNREAVLDRDDHKCQICNTSRYLVVHHRDGQGRGHSSPNNELDNLITLCRACHVRVHLPRLGTGRVKI